MTREFSWSRFEGLQVGRSTEQPQHNERVHGRDTENGELGETKERAEQGEVPVYRPEQNKESPRQHHHEDVSDQISRDREAEKLFRSHDVLSRSGRVAAGDQLSAHEDFAENASRHLDRVDDPNDLRCRVLGRRRRIDRFGRAQGVCAHIVRGCCGNFRPSVRRRPIRSGV